jgi:hypothetical protein
MNGRYVRFTPSRSANSFFAQARNATILVMSTSWVCVNCAVACKDSRVFFAVICRIRLAFWVVPRRWAKAGAGTAARAAGAGAAAAGADADGACGSILASPAASTSCLRMRPPTPVPLTDARSMLFSAASFRTSGVTYGAPSEADAAAAAAGARAAGAGAAGFGAGAGFGFGSGLGSGLGSGAGWAAGAGGAGAAAAAAPASLMTASSPPISTVSSSCATIFVSTPAAGDGISVSTLSVETSSRGSSSSTVSPSCLSQRVTVPSVTLSPSAGIWTAMAMCVDSSDGHS